jgi:serine/threonine protein kinase
MPVIGKTLAHYQITSQVGKGGMGEVRKARDTRLGRIAMIKMVKEQHSERFKQEAEIGVRTPRRRILSLKKDFHFNSRQSRASDFELGRCNAI